MANEDYGYFGKGSTGYAQYMTAFNRNFGGSSGGGGNHSGGGGGDGSGYEARFSKCGICALMQELGLSDLTPAMCHLDYAMSEAGGATNFVRMYTLASGGPYCDCGYKKKQM